MDVYVVVGWGGNMQAVEVFTKEGDAEAYLDLLVSAGLQGSYIRKRIVDFGVKYLYTHLQIGE